MRVSIDVQPKDRPGELIRIITPISDVGGNILSVIHRRDEKSRKGNLPVEMIFDIDTTQQMDKILEIYKKDNIKVLRQDEVKCLDELVVGMIGHIVQTDLSDTIDAIDYLGFCKVVDLDLEMPEKKKESCAIFHIEFDKTVKDGTNQVMSKIKEIGSKKDIQVIKSI